jgi:hypothetical protein
MKWVKDPKVESNLRRLGIPFEIESGIARKDIDLDEGWRRQVRLITKQESEDIQLKYGLAMKDPMAAFPMPILQKERRRYWPWSGNHRMGGCVLAEVDSIDAYIVQVFDPVLQDLLPRVVNTWEAVVGMSKDESITNARFMMDRHGWTTQDAAKTFGLSEKALLNSRLQAETRDLVERLGVATNGFTASMFQRSHTIRNHNAMRAAAALLQKYGLRGREAEAVCVDIARKDTETAQLAEASRWERVLEERVAPKRKRKKADPSAATHKEQNRERLIRLLTGLARFTDNVKSASQAQILDPAHWEQVERYWRSCQNGMRSILEGGSQ